MAIFPKEKQEAIDSKYVFCPFCGKCMIFDSAEVLGDDFTGYSFIHKTANPFCSIQNVVLNDKN